MTEFRVSFLFSASVARRAFVSLLWESRTVIVVLTPVVFAWALAQVTSREYGSAASFSMGVVLTIWVSWLALFRRAGAAVSTAGNPEVTLILADDTVTFRMVNAETIVRWQGISRVYRFKRFWVFVRTGTVYASVVPAELLSEDARNFIESKVRQAGGRLR
jgi:hypothetical protein